MSTRPLLVVVAFCLIISSAMATQSCNAFIGADDVHAQRITGLGVTVPVIDTGINRSHAGLTGGGAPGEPGHIANGGVSIIEGTEVPDNGQDIWPACAFRKL